MTRITLSSTIFLAVGYTGGMLVLDDNPAAGPPEAKQLEAWAERELKRLKAAGGTVETAHLPAGSPQARALSELLGLPDSVHSRKS